MAPPAAHGAQGLSQHSRGRGRPRPYRPREPFRQGERTAPVATAARPVFTMAEHSYGVEIPQEVVRHPFLLQAGKASTHRHRLRQRHHRPEGGPPARHPGQPGPVPAGGVRRQPAAERRAGGRALPPGGRGILRPACPVPLRRWPARPRPRPATRRRRLPPDPRRLGVRGHQMATPGHQPLRYNHPAHPPGEPEPTPSPGRIPPITAARAALHEISGSACMRRWDALAAYRFRRAASAESASAQCRSARPLTGPRARRGRAPQAALLWLPGCEGGPGWCGAVSCE